MIDRLDRLVAREVLDPLNDGFPEPAVLETTESLDGGSCARSEKCVASGDCSLEDVGETTTGEETAVSGEFCDVCPWLFDASFCWRKLSSGGSTPTSFVPPTEALSRVYRLLRPPCTSSIPLTSPVDDEVGGAVSSPKVVSERDRDAESWICWSAAGSAVFSFLLMAGPLWFE